MLNAVLSNVTIGVMGSGTDEHDDLARPIGELLARLGVNLLTGGGPGVMTAVGRAFTQSPRKRGISIGVIPCHSNEVRNRPKAGYPNQFVELAIYTHLPYSGKLGALDLSRNHINVLSSVAVVALPGGDGTASEVELALAYRKPIIAFSATIGMVAPFSSVVRHASTLDEVASFLRQHAGLPR
jgi:uncharacterized protein (TIGR00725 family)